ASGAFLVCADAQEDSNLRSRSVAETNEAAGRGQSFRARHFHRYDVPVGTTQDPRLLRRLLRAKDRMDSASHEEWPIPRLASVSGVSEPHFARSFKHAFGLPPHRYLLTRRIERAKALLRDTDQPITDIAFQTGWNSLGTFGRIFRDITGESPSELRAREQA